MGRCLLLGFLWILVTSLASCTNFQEHQPNIANGGRTVSLSADPQDNKVIFAAAESGGLFITKDGGSTWQHIAGFPEYGMSDVKFAPSNPNIVIATCPTDTKTTNGGGIWRSADQGTTWSMPATAVPPPSSRNPSRVSAYGICFDPDNNDVYVGTDHGVAVSTDLGATWNYVIPNSALPVRSDMLQDRIFSVLARGGGNVNAFGDSGEFYSGDNATTWQQAVGQNGDAWVIHGLAASPLNSAHVFLTMYTSQIRLSTDGGQTWAAIAPPQNSDNRPSFIKTAKSVTGNSNQFDLYYGNGTNLFRNTCTEGAKGPSLSATWQTLNVDHADPSDIAFDSTNAQPLLLATDGGVHKTPDSGATWKLTGGGTGGYNALQITEVNGQVIDANSQKVDLYFGTQDNDLWASPDAGATWPANVCCEGFFIGADRYNPSVTQSKITFVACSACGNLLSDPVFANVTGWPNVAGPVVGNPFFVSQGDYIQAGQLTGSTDNVFEFTDDVGASWTAKVIVSQTLQGAPLVVHQNGADVVYQGVSRPGFTPAGEPNEGLVRIDGISGSSPTIRDADGAGFGSLGIFPTMFAWYRVIGVDPLNPDHVIIADIANNVMSATRDGGYHWTPDQNLTNAVTDNGNCLFTQGAFPEAHVIAFNPFNDAEILVGTAQNGIIRSQDGGQHWAVVPNSQQITNISSFFFETSSVVDVATYGRGLWRLISPMAPIPHLPLAPEAVPLIRGPDGVEIPITDLGNPDVCPACTVVILSFGELTGIEFSGQSIQSISIDQGEAIFLDKSANRLPPTVNVLHAPSRSGAFSNNDILNQLALKGRHIRGLVLEGTKLRAVITCGHDISYLANKNGIARLPNPVATAVKLSAPSLRIGQNSIPVGETLTVTGSGYGKTPRTFEISIANTLFDKTVQTDANGGFQVSVPLKLPVGIYKVIVRDPVTKALEAVEYINVQPSDMDNDRDK